MVFVNWNDLQYMIHICCINYELHIFLSSTKMKNLGNRSILFLNNLLYVKYILYIEASFHCVLLRVKDLGLQREALVAPDFPDPPRMRGWGRVPLQGVWTALHSLGWDELR